jgi:hypothetical protein
LAVSARVAHAQETINYASVSGRVTDSQSAVVPGAYVTARQTDTNVKAETDTDSEGRFRFPYLRVGPYEITVHLDGFKDSRRTLALTVGAAFDIPFELAVGGVETNVTVAAEATVLEAARSQIAGTVAQAEVRSLPMNGRNFLDLALLIPGVSPTNIGSTQLFAETSAVPGQGISIGSQRNLSNSFIVDGLSANDDAAGVSGIPFGVDAVEQFQVVTSGGHAELGRALGGYINVVTKSGANNRHGTLYDFVRDDNFNAPNALSGNKLPMDQQQFGGSLGGPIVRDRTFYFSNFEQRLLDQTGLVTVLSENVPIINDRLAAVGYPGGPISTGIYPNPLRSANLLGKIDHQVGASDQLTVRYALYHVTSTNSRGAGALNAPTASAGLDNVDHSLAFANTWTISPRTVNETRAQFAYGDLHAPPTDPIGPAVGIAGVASFGTLSGSPTRRVNTMYQVVDSLSHRAGAHALRAGVDFVFNDDTIPARPGQLCLLQPCDVPHRKLQRVQSDVWGPGRLADQPKHRRACTGRVEGRFEPDPEFRAALRHAVPGSRQDRYQQRIAARRFRMVAVRCPRSRDPRQCRPVLRSRPASRRRQHHPVGAEQHRSRQAAAAQRVGHHSDAGGRANVSRHSPGAPADDHARRLHDHGQEPAERVLEAGQPGNGALARSGPNHQRRLPVPAGETC